jgi:molybdopterin converting factor small subunit
MRLEIFYFGWVAERTGTQEESIDMEAESTVSDLRECLLKRYPELSGMSFRIASDRELVQDEERAALRANAELALLPAYAGG